MTGTECSGTGRNHHNFWLDVATTLIFSAMIGTGILLEFVLAHGRGAAWLGLGRHDWGEVHFYLGVALVGLIATHLVLHRAWIAKCWTRFAGTTRSPLTWGLLASAVVLIVLPLVVPAEAGPGRGSRGRSSVDAARGGGEGVARPRHDRPRRGHRWE